ncbi:MAG: molybdopterin molybdenumtransferase MoeA [Verrucomicrobiales bacterium]|nr:molybdopterin molybdenumtransferase MoeA [Verrucomicrobiales bacterium]
MLEESEARRRILDAVEPGSVTWVPLELAMDQVLAQPIAGVMDSPLFDNSSMDGYAVMAEEAVDGAELKVAEVTQAAGEDLRLRLKPGEAIRIFTGAPIPADADAVIMQEDVERTGDTIKIVEGVVVGENIRRRGGDVCSGQHLLDAGELMTPTKLGLLASQGIPEIPVYARPLVEIVTTGDELVEPGAPLVPGEIYNSNGPMLQTAVSRVGGVGVASHAVDDVEDLRMVLGRALAASDVVVIAGGVSVGERDFVKEVLGEVGVEMDFWRVKVKPGKPFLFGRHPDGTLVFGVPGNPVSAYVTFCLFVAPAVRRILGMKVDGDSVGLGKVSGIASEDLVNKGDRPHYLRGIYQDGEVRLSGTQQSHAIFGLSRANCLIRLEPEQVVKKGEQVTAFEI